MIGMRGEPANAIGPSAPANGVVEGDIAPDGGAGLRDTGLGMQVDLVIFDGPPKPFDEDLVAPCSFVSHADLDLAPGQHLDEVSGGELAAWRRIAARTDGATMLQIQDVRFAVTRQRCFHGFPAKIGLRRDRASPCPPSMGWMAPAPGVAMRQNEAVDRLTHRFRAIP